MMRTQTFAINSSLRIEKEEIRTFTVPNEVYQWVYLHGLKRIVLNELIQQTQSFPPSKPSMRRKLMKEIRKASLERYTSSHSEESLHTTNKQRMLRELMEYLAKRQKAASQNLFQDKRRTLLLSLHKQHCFRKVSCRTQLLCAIREFATERLKFRDYMTSVRNEVMEKIKDRIGHHVIILPYREHYQDLKREILIFVASRTRTRLWKQVVLLEFMWHRSLFTTLGMRKQLMAEIRAFSLRFCSTQFNIPSVKSHPSLPIMTIHEGVPVLKFRRTNSSAAA
jgi:hypothetical protein